MSEKINGNVINTTIVSQFLEGSRVGHELEVDQEEEINHFPEQQPLNEEQLELIANGRQNAVNNNIVAQDQSQAEEHKGPIDNINETNGRKIVNFLNKSLAKIVGNFGDMVNSKTLLKYSANLGEIKFLHKLADLYYKEHNYGEAEELYKILAEVHQNSDAMTRLAVISLARNDLQAAERWYKLAIATDDKNFDALTTLAKIYYAQGLNGDDRAFKEAYELIKLAFPAIAEFAMEEDEYKSMKFGDKYHQQYFDKYLDIYLAKNIPVRPKDYKKPPEDFSNDRKIGNDFVDELEEKAHNGHGSAMLALASYHARNEDYRLAYEFARMGYERFAG